MIVYHRGAAQILKTIFTRKKQSIIFHGETNTDGEKRALIRTVSVLCTAFHPQISQCFNMTALSLFTIWATRRNCTQRQRWEREATVPLSARTHMHTCADTCTHMCRHTHTCADTRTHVQTHAHTPPSSWQHSCSVCACRCPAPSQAMGTGCSGGQQCGCRRAAATCLQAQ